MPTNVCAGRDERRTERFLNPASVSEHPILIGLDAVLMKKTALILRDSNPSAPDGCQIINPDGNDARITNKRSNEETSSDSVLVDPMISGENQNDERHMAINQAAVLSTLVSGIGHFQIEKWLSSVRFHFTTEKTFTNILDTIMQAIIDTANQLFKKNGEEELRTARLEGRVTKTGMGRIPIITDASWGTRSYGMNYMSHTGIAMISGKTTGKPLCIGCRNRYCRICIKAENETAEAKEHVCSKNWDTYASSGAMEVDIVLEGC
ncbi:hypothetical protein QAD02_000756 [Eretmocerus hayati]|uniref:Uncharacterized protein n=1 Tax=Eretmocerus hayati TaxID=131215 RepID=A0ACC2NEB1_9HYME|nr:hypothetical protein QAD02_000756 [Eretmocerus hayati]